VIHPDATPAAAEQQDLATRRAGGEHHPFHDAPSRATRWWRHGPKAAALLFWLMALGLYQWYAARNGLSPLDVVRHLIGFLGHSIYGPLLYIAVYAVRPLLLFPASLLTLAGAFVFGPVWGMLLVIIGSNASALLAYTVGRFFGHGLVQGGADGVVQRYADRMRTHGFETVFLMRLLFVPYDAVNYLAGFLHIHWLPFIAATALGSLPGTAAFVLFGASIKSFDGGLPSFNPIVLVASVALFVASLVVSRLFKRREGNP